MYKFGIDNVNGFCIYANCNERKCSGSGEYCSKHNDLHSKSMLDSLGDFYNNWNIGGQTAIEGNAEHSEIRYNRMLASQGARENYFGDLKSEIEENISAKRCSDCKALFKDGEIMCLECYTRLYQNQLEDFRQKKILCVACGKNKGISDLNNLCKDCYDQDIVQWCETMSNGISLSQLLLHGNWDAISNVIHSNSSADVHGERIYKTMKLRGYVEKKEFICAGCDKKVYEKKDYLGLCSECREKLGKRRSGLEAFLRLLEVGGNNKTIEWLESGSDERSGNGELMVSDNDTHNQYYDRGKICHNSGCFELSCR